MAGEWVAPASGCLGDPPALWLGGPCVWLVAGAKGLDAGAFGQPGGYPP